MPIISTEPYPISGMFPIPQWIQDRTIHLVETVEQLRLMVTDLMRNEIAYDTEATGYSPINDRMVSAQFCGEEGVAYFVPIGMIGLPNIPREAVADICKPIWERGWIGHNAGFDWKMTTQLGVDSKILADTHAEAQCIPKLWLGKRSFKLKDLSQKILGLEVVELEDFFEKKMEVDFLSVPLGEAISYGAQDVFLTKGLHRKLMAELDPSDKILRIETAVIKPLARMELLGIGLDMEVLPRASAQVSARLHDLEQQIYRIAGHPVGLSKPRELETLLFNELGLKPGKPTKTGGFSVDKQVLAAIYHDHEIVPLISEWRGLATLQNNFLETLPAMVEKDGCIHPSFNRWAARTGRLSCSQPNEQQVPQPRDDDDIINTTIRRSIRAAHLPPNGFIGFLDQDFNQVEYRLFATFSQDPVLLDAYARDQDMHKRVASIMFKLPYDEVTKDQRDIGKQNNFAALYGQQAKALARAWRMPLDQAQSIVDDYWAAIPVGHRYIGKLKSDARRVGYSETYFGRKRLLPDIRSRSEFDRSAAERRSVNSPVQGCLGGDTTIYTRELGCVSLRDAVGKTLSVWNGTEYCPGTVVSSGMKRKSVVVFQNGQRLVCTADHKLLTVNTKGVEVWKAPDKFGDSFIRVRQSDAPPCFSSATYEEPFSDTGNRGASNRKWLRLRMIQDDFDLGVAMGRLASDGHIGLNAGVRTPKYLNWMVAEHEFKDVYPELRRILTNAFGVVREVHLDRTKEAKLPMHYLYVDSMLLSKECLDIDLKHRIPNHMWCNKELLRGFLRGMFDGDGTVSKVGVSLTFGKGSFYDLYARDVQKALAWFGIESRLAFCTGRINVNIRKKDCSVFATSIGFMNSKKQEKALNIDSKRKENCYGRALALDCVEFTDEYVEMFDVVNCVDNKFAADGLIVHNSAADIVKMALIRADKALQSGFKSRMVLTVHDQIVTAHHPDDNLDDLCLAMREALEIPLPGFVPLTTSLKYGPNWGAVEKREYPSG